MIDELRPLVATILDLHHADVIDRAEARRLLGIEQALEGDGAEAEALADFAELVAECEVVPTARDAGLPCYLGTDIPIEADDIVLVRWTSQPASVARVVSVHTLAGGVVANVEDERDGRYSICPLVHNAKGEPYMTYVDFDEDNIPLEDLDDTYAWARA